MDFSTIASAIQAAKGAKEMAQAIIRSDSALQKAELKRQILEVTEALSESISALFEAQQNQIELHSEVERLETALRLQGRVKKCGDAYFMLSQDGKPEGDALCLACWQNDH